MNKSNIKNNILEFSNDNHEPEWLTRYRIEAFKKIDDYNHPSFGPEIKLDIDLNQHLENRAVTFHIEEEGFLVCDIHTAFIKYKGLIEKYYSKLITSEENRYTILNSTIFESGYFVYVFKDKKINFPIFNKNINCDFSKNIIIVDENSELNIIDYSKNNSEFRNDCTEIFVEKNSRCRYVNLNLNSNYGTVVSMKRALVGENAEMNWINVIKGSKTFMGYPSSILNGKGSKSTSITLSLITDDSSINIGSRMIHKSPFTKSKIVNISDIYGTGEIETRNLVNIDSSAEYSNSNVEFVCSSSSINSKYDNVPRYTVDNDTSSVSFNITNTSNTNSDIISFIEDNFIALSKQNKKILHELIKKSI